MKIVSFRGYLVLLQVIFLTLYLGLIVAYVGVLKYMAEKPEEALQADPADRAAVPGAVAGGAA